MNLLLTIKLFGCTRFFVYFVNYLISICSILVNMHAWGFFRQCSNLMLVESVPKEPLSFQVIPFDNPRGQHTLQVNMFFRVDYIYYLLCYDSTARTYETYTGSIPVIDLSCVFSLFKAKSIVIFQRPVNSLGLMCFFYPISIKFKLQTE